MAVRCEGVLGQAVYREAEKYFKLPREDSPMGRPRGPDEGDLICDDAIHADELVAKAETALASDERCSANDRAARLRGDQRLVEAILAQGLQCQLHRDLENALVEYAIPILKHLIATGEITSRCWRLGRPIESFRTYISELSEREREEFAVDMAGEAVSIFNRRVFEDRRWTAEGGAALTTYFVNACVGQFPSLFRTWCRRHRRDVLFGLEFGSNSVSKLSDPESRAVMHDEALRALVDVSDNRLREVVAWRAMGYSHDAASTLAGITAKAAEGRLRRHRQRVQGRSVSGNGDVSGEGRPA
ncbi:hypothetical protein Airi02_060510 [Actinoallomurus iriomotensis]|uniref:Uncharacterized protein n=2 Tax=Actinoallomurus iriomotensis TaxID=478107 RepID=A0A9W6S9F1_9ACTN|nr:hypothetical protein Airi02_060510 [Actinoallomurus iriomotensis]